MGPNGVKQYRVAHGGVQLTSSRRDGVDSPSPAETAEKLNRLALDRGRTLGDFIGRCL